MVFNRTTFHLLALGLTLLVEGAGMTLWARLAHLQIKRALFTCLLVNLVVHTLFWLTQPIFLIDWPMGLVRAELLVVVLEGATYARGLAWRGWQPWLASVLLNSASLLAGLWLWQLLL